MDNMTGDVANWNSRYRDLDKTKTTSAVEKKKLDPAKFEKELEKLRALTLKLKQGIDILYADSPSNELYSASITAYSLERLLNNER